MKGSFGHTGFGVSGVRFTKRYYKKEVLQKVPCRVTITCCKGAVIFSKAFRLSGARVLQGFPEKNLSYGC